MMIDVATIYALELVQNLQNAKSKDCLYGLMNRTMTPMGARLLKNNVLQPLTERNDLEERYEAIEELATREDVFFAAHQGAFGWSRSDFHGMLTCYYSTQSFR